MQLDLFEHSADVIARNDVIEALLAREVVLASRRLVTLTRDFPDDSLVPALHLLCDRTLGIGASPAAPFVLVDDAQATELAARRAFGERAQSWLLAQWAEYAHAIGSHPFDPAQEHRHAVPWWLRAGRFETALAQIATIPQWRRRPAVLAWAAQAHFGLEGFEQAWPLLVELAWMTPARARTLAQSWEHPSFQALLRRYDLEYEGTGSDADFAWFPAWVLIDKPQHANALRLAAPGQNTAPERAARLLVSLLEYEHQGRQRELVDARRRLKDIDEELFHQYMRRR